VGELGACSVNFYGRPWVRANDYWDVKFALTENIKQAFDDNGISIPFPQMDIHLNKIK
jgi:small conductance mechanosensitive channel